MDISKPVDPAELFSAKDLVIVITGGATGKSVSYCGLRCFPSCVRSINAQSGIGLAFTSALANAGAHKVYILGRRLQPLQDAAKQVNANVVVPIQCDVTDPASVAAAAKQVEDETGYVDVVINNSYV